MLEHPRRVARRIAALLHWRRRNTELAEEIATHAEMKRAEFERAGFTPENARAAARRAMGNTTSMREQARGVWLFTWSESVWQDVAYGLRSLRRQPAFTAAALLGLGCGLGFNAALFASFNALALRGFSVRESSRMTALFGSARDNRLNRQSLGFSLDEVRYLSQRAQSLSGIILTERSTSPVNGDDPIFMPVSANYFQVLGVGMERGRGFTPDDDRVTVPQQVIVVSHDFWQRRLGGDAGALGTSVRIRGIAFTVIGIASASFTGTEVRRTDAWIPMASVPIVRPRDAGIRDHLAAARLAEGATRETAAAELSALLAAMPRSIADSVPRKVTALPFTVFGAAGPGRGMEHVQLFLLIGVGVALVLLLACANIANLLLARSTARQREISVRLSLGASRSRVIRQLMTESLLLATFACAIAIALASWLPPFMIGFSTSDTLSLSYTPDARILVFTASLAIASCVLFGLTPALHATRPAGTRTGRLPLHSAFLSAQVAFCVILLVTAGLFVRSLGAGRTLDLGFAAHDLTDLTIALPATSDDSLRTHRLPSELSAIIASAGVTRAAFSMQEPFSLNGMNYRMPGSMTPRFSLLSEVSPEYFVVTDRRIIVGRALSVQDAGSDAIVVNESFAQKFGGVAQALGKSVFSGASPLTIVGVVANAQDSDVGESRVPDVVYRFPAWNGPPHIVVRGDPAVARRLAAAITARDPSLFVRIRSFDWYVNDRLSGRLTAAAIAGLLGILALVLATVGMFGVFSYWVQQRTQDIGIRMALGATRGSVLRLVLSVSSRAVMWGLIIGVAGAVAGARLLQHSLNGLSPLDLPTFAGAIAVLVSAGLLATAVPAWRAVHVDPIRSLRVE
jgi:predicted permease